MGFLDKLLSREKEEKKEPLEEGLFRSDSEAIIPIARRRQMAMEAMEQKAIEAMQKKEDRTERERRLPVFADEKPRFLVEGVFAVIDTLMVKGTVVSGQIKKGMLFKVEKKKFRSKDLQLQGRAVPLLLKGQQGAIFFDKAKGLSLKAGTTLEFKSK